MTVKFIGLGDVEKNLLKLVKVQPIAISRAMNEAHRTGVKVSTGKKTGVTKDWGIKVADFKRYTWTKKATRASYLTQYAVQSRPINLKDFKAKENKKGVSYKLKGKQRTMKGAFLAKGYFLKRTGKKRMPIIPHFSVTPTSMFQISNGEDLYSDAYMKKFEDRYFHYINYLTK